MSFTVIDKLLQITLSNMISTQKETNMKILTTVKLGNVKLQWVRRLFKTIHGPLIEISGHHYMRQVSLNDDQNVV